MALLLLGRRIIQRKYFSTTSANNGYIVLLPEIGEVSAKDQLCENNGLPEFSNVTIENCTASIAKQTLEFESGVKKIEKDLDSTDVDIVKDVLEPLEILSSPLELTWGISKTLYLGNNTLIPTKTYLPIHERARRARSTKYNNVKIFEAVQKELSLDKQWNPEVKRVLSKFSLEGKLNGLGLKDEKKVIFFEILQKIAKEKETFKQKIDIQTQNFSHVIQDLNVVRDFPQSLLQSTSVDTSKGPWKVTLQQNVYLPVMQYCGDRMIRWNLWQASVNRGSGTNDKVKGTGLHIEELRYQRHDLAKLLGYKTFADMSMETKMAGSVDNIKNTINDLLEKAKPAQDSEVENLMEFAANNGFNHERLELWDLPYWRKKQELSLYNYNPNEYKKYFPFPKVLQGMFELSEKLFNIVIKHRSDVSTWHKDVKFYDILEPHQSAPVAGFYLDPYSRKDSKVRNINSNGWMVGIQNKSSVCDNIPLASLIFNFDLPANGNPSHLDVKEVYSLFFRFGHALQHLLTRTSYSEVAGHSNVEWDMVEVCGHVFSNFLFNEDILRNISHNSETGETLPKDLVNSMFEVRKHMAGMDLCRELYLSALDLELYSNRDYWMKIVKNLWPKFRSLPLDKQDMHICSFTPIFTEEWAASYYSHFWSKMIAADVFSAFEEVKGDENELIGVGKRFRDTFLELGGSVQSGRIFRQFRGRDPSPKALLSSLGLKNDD